MKILNEEPRRGKPANMHVLILSTEEARTLVAMAEAACFAYKRKRTWRSIHKQLCDSLCCW